MGLLIDGVWQEQEPAATRARGGEGRRAKADAAKAAGASSARHSCVPQLGDAGRTARPDRQRRLLGCGQPLSSVCVAGLPLGASHADHARAEGAGADHSGIGHALADGRAGLELHAGRGRDPRSAVQQPLPARDLHPRRCALYRPCHRAGAVGPAHADHRQQRIIRDHPHVQQRLRWRWAPGRATIIRRTCARRSTR